MSGMDGAFLHMETPTLPMHTLKIFVFSGEPPTLQDLSSHAEAWLARVPRLRDRVVTVPLKLGQPLFERDREFIFQNHVSFIAARAPGRRRELDDIVELLAHGVLPRDRPLWQLAVVTSLAGGQWAVVVKIHHALADGVASVAMVESLVHTTAPVAEQHAEEHLGRLGVGVSSLYRSMRALPSLVRKTAEASYAIWHRRHEGGRRPAGVFQAPVLELNGELDERRRFASAELAFSRVKCVKDATASTVNDVLIAVVAGALRRYLAARDELPDVPLVAAVPVAIGEMHRLAGNAVASLFAPVPTHVAEPLKRLAIAKEGMRAAKEEFSLLASVEREWTEAIPPFAFAPAMKAQAALGMNDRIGPPINLILSNVPGPREPIRIAGRDVERIVSVGPLVANVGLNVTVWSYRGYLMFGLLGSARADVAALVELLDPALAELEGAVSP